MSEFRHGFIQGGERAKVCLVTIGATAPFNGLIREVLTEPFLAQLQKYDYTHLVMQYGKEGTQIFLRFIETNPAQSEAVHGIKVGGFDYAQDMGPFLRMAMSDFFLDQDRGMLICHAGEECTGSILDGLRAGLAVMVVPNPDLADNHQEELADQLDRTGYVVKASLGTIAASVDEVEARRQQRKSRPQSDLALKDVMLQQIPNVD